MGRLISGFVLLVVSCAAHAELILPFSQRSRFGQSRLKREYQRSKEANEPTKVNACEFFLNARGLAVNELDTSLLRQISSRSPVRVGVFGNYLIELDHRGVLSAWIRSRPGLWTRAEFTRPLGPKVGIDWVAQLEASGYQSGIRLERYGHFDVIGSTLFATSLEGRLIIFKTTGDIKVTPVKIPIPLGLRGFTSTVNFVTDPVGRPIN